MKFFLYEIEECKEPRDANCEDCDGYDPVCHSEMELIKEFEYIKGTRKDFLSVLKLINGVKFANDNESP